ncbi:Uncharacterised protein [Mycobacteroides abscessus subsp. abscessus]|uniref:Lipoprotein n=1 Tax=Mycobacteroides abscessus subsp. abscessus TaxID=1185650 RepID=A0AB38D851_9MYCO|nr:hypothetical protein [Mycobacteroides abscessus]MBE5505793.1 hypothetical protein [Mycobacteroides abscessus]MBN7329831.1 hypothetical protein [Mycobacteroides abscessus subsp. abscessus]MBN7564492.1 hypothetical protein [Mycobacteroides abscessus subsp. massiliense]MDO2989382.1 hypothetical protein [Mycobacteroides abscessus subsp. massiliense]MDO3053348.1 hypothetical protein [Mycobacteroides abscessus subsp. massiliense]
MTHRLLVVLSLAAALLSGCFGTDRSDPLQADRFVRPDHPVASPSGEYTAYIEYGPEENGVKTWLPVVRDKTGKEVFRDHDDMAAPYSTRHMLYVTWLSSKPAELWIYSGDVGTFSVARRQDGSWTKQHNAAPEEIKDLHP